MRPAYLTAQLPRVDDDPAVKAAEATFAEISRQLAAPRQRLAELASALVGMRRSHRDYAALAAERAELEKSQPGRDRYLAEAASARDAARAEASVRIARSLRGDQHLHLARIAQGIAEVAMAVSDYDAWLREHASRGVDRGFDEVPVPRHFGRPDDADSLLVAILTSYAAAGVDGVPSPMALAARVASVRAALATRPAA